MLEFIKIYKNFYKTSECSQLLNSCEHSIYTIQNFNNLSKLNDLKLWCENNEIYTLNKYTTIINDNIKNLQHIFNEPKLNNFIEFDIKSHIPFFFKLDTEKKYLSLDLKHSFSQLIDSLHIFNEKFDNIIFDNLPIFIRNSKKARIFMYHQIDAHDILKNSIFKLFDRLFESDHKIAQYLKDNNLIPISCNVDELVYDITETPNLFDEFIGDHTINGINIHLNTFEQHYISFIDPFTKKEKTIHIREYATHTHFATYTCPYMNQLYKVYNNLPIIENDLYIPHQTNWNKIIKLDEPIIITNVE